ncbi:hypothetical protein [Porphyromonas macacae]|uniref:hypothetical protein n=1 Tax=Porphyromonas macacae TaxID=28115 RepID=UPI00039F258A|nr:hypothetical protein [Porphyromonas macacae]
MSATTLKYCGLIEERENLAVEWLSEKMITFIHRYNVWFCDNKVTKLGLTSFPEAGPLIYPNSKTFSG